MILVLEHLFLQGRSMPPLPPPIPRSSQLPEKRPMVAPECLLYHRKADFLFNVTTVEKPYLREIGLSGSTYLQEHSIMDLDYN